MYYNTKKLNPGLVASYDIWPGNGEGLFWFWCFINLSLTYLLRHLLTYLQSRTHTGLSATYLPFQWLFPGEPGFASSPQFSSSTYSGREFVDKWQKLLNKPDASCHSTTSKETQSIDRQTVAWPHPFCIHHWTLDGRGVAPIMPAFQHYM